MRKFRQADFPPGFLSQAQVDLIDRYNASRPFSILWEVRALLYLGVLFLTGGLGILIYRNIDTIGHQIILLAIGVLTACCLGYCAWKAEPFASKQVMQDPPWLDYMLLLGVLLFGIFVGYLQIEYSVFGSRYGLAVGLPALFYLFLAYRFDHRGVLQLAMSGIAAAFGIVATPLEAFKEGLFYNHLPIYAGLGVAAALAWAGALSGRLDFKRHFAFSYINFAAHLGMIAVLTGMISGKGWREAAYALLLILCAAALWKYSKRMNSPYFLLITVLYAYAGFTYLCMHLLFSSGSTSDLASLVFLYFIISCAGAIVFFLNIKTILGNADAGIQEK